MRRRGEKGEKERGFQSKILNSAHHSRQATKFVFAWPNARV